MGFEPTSHHRSPFREFQTWLLGPLSYTSPNYYEQGPVLRLAHPFGNLRPQPGICRYAISSITPLTLRVRRKSALSSTGSWLKSLVNLLVFLSVLTFFDFLLSLTFQNTTNWCSIQFMILGRIVRPVVMFSVVCFHLFIPSS